jgi:hypothetical protein
MTDAPPATWGDLAAEHKPRTDTVRVCMRGDLVAEIGRLEQQLPALERADAMSNDPDRAPELARRILDLQAEAAAHEREFVFTAIGQRAWSGLLADHPPTDEQRQAGADHNPETFPYEAVARSCTNVAGTATDVQVLADRLSLGDWSKLWNCCLAVNLGGTVLPKCVGATALLQHSDES